MRKSLYLVMAVPLIFLTACGQKPVVKIYPAAKGVKIEALALEISPPDKSIRSALEDMYRFDPSADTVLQVGHKERIVCNSSQNAPQKALSSFPHNFLRIEVKRGDTLYYSYYIDLEHKVDRADIERAFERMKRDLGI